MHTPPGGICFIKGNLRTRAFIHLIIFGRTPFLAFERTYTFSTVLRTVLYTATLTDVDKKKHFRRFLMSESQKVDDAVGCLQPFI